MKLYNEVQKSVKLHYIAKSIGSPPSIEQVWLL